MIVYMMAGMDTLVKAVQTMQFGEVSTYFQNGYAHWYDIIVAGILMWWGIGIKKKKYFKKL